MELKLEDDESLRSRNINFNGLINQQVGAGGWTYQEVYTYSSGWLELRWLLFITLLESWIGIFRICYEKRR